MLRASSLAILASVASFTLAPTAAWAASPSQEACEEAGGTFTRDGGQVRCVTTTTEPGKNPRFEETTTTETTGQGNTQNKTERKQDSDCEGTGSDKCPPGQF